VESQADAQRSWGHGQSSAHDAQQAGCRWDRDVGRRNQRPPKPEGAWSGTCVRVNRPACAASCGWDHSTGPMPGTCVVIGGRSDPDWVASRSTELLIRFSVSEV
jgi:hypothetical protein